MFIHHVFYPQFIKVPLPTELKNATLVHFVAVMNVLTIEKLPYSVSKYI